MDTTMGPTRTDTGGTDSDGREPGWVTLGTVGAAGRATLDRRARTSPEGARWVLEWWVGAEDRWHTCGDAPVVRQSSTDSTPVVLSAMRLPGGELEHRAWAVADPAGDGAGSLVIELHNATPVPVAVAFALRPAADAGAISSIDLVGRDVLVDGEVALVLSKEPSRYAVGTASSADVLEVTSSEEATSRWPEGGVRCERAGASAALIFPLPHTATLRVVLPLHGPELFGAERAKRAVSATDVGALPPSDRVVAGWKAQTARAPRFELPERLLESATLLTHCHLLVHCAGEDPLEWPGVPVDGLTRAELCMALDERGFHAESARVLRAAIDLQQVTGSFDDDRLDATAGWLVAMGRHTELSDDPMLAGEAVGQIAVAAHWLFRRQVGRRLRSSTRFFGSGAGPAGLDPAERVAYDARWTLRAYRAATSMLRRVGQRDAAMEIERHAIDLTLSMGGRAISEQGPGSGPLHGDTIGRVRSMLATGEPLWSWSDGVDGHSPARTAEFLRAARALVVDDGDGSIAVVPVVPDEWFGQPAAVHDLPTSAGTLSFAIRWHGLRPALLWDLVAHDGARFAITAPGLDPQWSTTDERGEALLAQPEGLVHVDEHVHDHAHDHGHDHGSVAPPPPDEGGSFS